MKLHPREQIVNTARTDLTEKLLQWHKAHDLTDGELFSVIGDVLGGQIANLAKYMIRAERHPDDPDKPGGWE
jgi:hypothetical protein